ncbi:MULTISPECIES: chemotaxis protein CheW [Nitrospirillum]|uniref:Chemotaxis protein CheW n=1 Tax=Nitrospirillum amazonense TaxID=28077 RepID=A0A560GCP6_9PROT|nr:chemotaxis protein CheW [Nitrospirillum amazonense]MEC4594692.1 chemotaxis protein CheW [Nitrospirillum amazonense]TWB31688.1 CheW protein [Nitrospirillum amazonense]
MAASKAAGGRRQHVLTFRVGAARLAASAADVIEVLRPVRVTRVPHAPAGLTGVASVRGTVVPVLSLARLLGGEEAASGAASRLLLLQAEEPVALTVDEVGALAQLDAGADQAAGGLYVHEDGALRLIDLAELLRREFAGLVRRGDGPGRAEPAEPRRQAAKDESAFLAFTLADQAYALPLAEVGEVITLPDHLMKLPRTDAAMVGAASLRGALLPIVSLRALLGLGIAAGDQRGARVVVAHVGGSRVGLLVDRLNSILRVPADSVGAVPAVLNRGRGEAQIQSICRLPDGRGLVSILSGARLFRDDTVAHILADGGPSPQEARDMNPERHATTGDRVVVFQLGDEEYGLPVDAVEEVVRLPDTLTRVPKAPGFIEGVMNLRGQVLPVIDQRRRFGVAGSGTGRRRVIVTRINGKLAGFAVDGVSEILALPAGRVSDAPDFSQAGDAEGAPVFSRIANLETVDGAGRMILLIEPQALLDRAERDLLAALDAALKGDGAQAGNDAMTGSSAP